MTVLLYQALIVVSLIIVRILTPKYLIHLAWLWSAWSLLLIQVPWLMILQLAVTWIAYAKLSPNEPSKAPPVKKPAAPKAKIPVKQSAQRAKKPTPIARPVKEEQREGFLTKVNNGLENLNDSLDLATQKMEIDALFTIEEAVIRNIQERAKKRQDIGPEIRAMTVSQLRQKDWSELQPQDSDWRDDLTDAINAIVAKAAAHHRAAIKAHAKNKLDRRENARRDVRALFKADDMLRDELGYFWPMYPGLMPILAPEPPKPAPAPVAPAVMRPHGPAIAKIIRDRGITSLVHFTNLDNLSSIEEHGLLPLSDLRKRGLEHVTNDRQRVEGHPDALCLSISHPNARMFYKYRREARCGWAVLELSPDILTTHECSFYPRNAADHRMRGVPRSVLGTPEAFEAMFSGLDGRPADRAPNLPTDSQAEALVFGRIGPEHIRRIHVETDIEAAAADMVLTTRLAGYLIESTQYFRAAATA
ncbi:DarT ssDNA thymidine ADP-ribosyltransferase family protein [Pseudoprimorskyibacter insulae]|uniref:DarT domain-containing protein n=1 Tax=Pseudoprimorskyibacter insulae TaxID=1695997 RepID=A0A2R8AWA8_9RHOB|nr:DarT ssDNA thymidine ADP-ribosyltransferase family protein [Pseudoprimorskyibacter insulae]SPF80326.1 hypothetical protein PRI8871_02130 [Pseudoprimorskyibacter insulae]